MASLRVFLLVLLVLMTLALESEAALPKKVLKKIKKVNKRGPYLGLVVPGSLELTQFLNLSTFKSYEKFPVIDASGRRFRVGFLDEKKVILVMTGLGMINAGLTTQLLLTLFYVQGVIHYGISGNADPSLNLGDVIIPQYWAHTGNWNWQRFGDGPTDELALEEIGISTREFGCLTFSDFNNITDIWTAPENSLNSIWYQPQEIYPIDGTPETKQRIFWVSSDCYYFQEARKLEGMELEWCINASTCLLKTPQVHTVEKGASASILLDNAAYRSFLFSNFSVSAFDMESASVALVSYQQGIPFIVIRGLTDLAGGGSAQSHEAYAFTSLIAKNAMTVALQFIKNMKDIDVSSI